MKPRSSPGQLASRLSALEVRVESALVEDRSLTLPDYPGGPRPSRVVRLEGGGSSGEGENVAFSAQDQERFAAYVARWFSACARRGKLRVGTALSTEGTPYERAALEAALIDLALRQAGLTLYELSGVRSASLRFVSSLAASADPEAVIRGLREQGFQGELKMDVDPGWDGRVLERVAQDSRIAIFDFKGRAAAALAQRLYAAHSSALFEDPPSGFEAPSAARLSRVSRDAPLLDEGEVAAALARGEAVNLKAPRMGGPLAVLRGLEHVWAWNQLDSPPRAYLGGMFEIGVGRGQARQLAALYCAAAPNDLALNVPDASAARARAESPALIRFDEPALAEGCQVLSIK